MIATLLFLAILSQESTPALPRVALGHGFIEDCRVDPNTTPGWDALVKKARCLYYLEGLSDGLARGGLLCVPAQVTLGQTQAVVLKYLEDHPEILHEPRSIIAREALLKHWACRPARK